MGGHLSADLTQRPQDNSPIAFFFFCFRENYPGFLNGHSNEAWSAFSPLFLSTCGRNMCTLQLLPRKHQATSKLTSPADKTADARKMLHLLKHISFKENMWMCVCVWVCESFLALQSDKEQMWADWICQRANIDLVFLPLNTVPCAPWHQKQQLWLEVDFLCFSFFVVTMLVAHIKYSQFEIMKSTQTYRPLCKMHLLNRLLM